MWIYKNFRTIYDAHKKKIDIALDEFSYRLISHVNNDNVLAMFDEINDLSFNIKSIIVKSFRNIFFHHKSMYLSFYKMHDSNSFKDVWEISINNLNSFLDKTINSLSNQIFNEYYTSNTSEFITWILPVKKGKGRFHGRFKTMLYMLSICFMNNISKHINKTNGHESKIIDFKYNNEIVSENGLFKGDPAIHILWKNGIGLNAPSYFGSKQVIIPHK